MKKTILILSFIGAIITTANAQGCSDAGFCSVGNTFKGDKVDLKNNLEVGAVYGIGEKDVKVYSPYLIYTRIFSKHFGLSTKLTSNVANGSFGTRANIGDVFITGNYKFNTSDYDKSKWSGILGVKIPLTAGNDKINTVSLPMPYQSSLGTFDVIAGIDLAMKKWEFSTAIQVPLNNNKNSYLKELAPTKKFVSTNLFERKSDALFRAAYKFKTGNQKFTFKPNVLFIYHLGNDSFMNSFGIKEEIKKSEGITINANLITSYKIASNSSLEASLASPLVVREVRPDGLTRALTFGLSYKQNF